MIRIATFSESPRNKYHRVGGSLPTRARGYSRRRLSIAAICALVTLPACGDGTGPGQSPERNGRLVFSSRENDPEFGRQQIFAIDADGGNKVVLVSEFADAYYVLGPRTGGTRISFVRVNGNVSSVYTMQADGSQLVGPFDFSTFGDVSRDGTRMVLYTGPRSIAVGNLLTGDTTVVPIPEGRPIEPFWAPDGESIVFTWQDSLESGNGLYTIRRDGTLLRRLPTGRGSVDSPRWSPDGERIAFSRTAPFGGPISLHTITPLGADFRDVAPIDCRNLPAWSPDGTALICRDFIGQSWIVDMETGEFRLTDGCALWSPDATKVICGKQGTYIANVDGTEPTAIFPWDVEPSSVRWLSAEHD